MYSPSLLEWLFLLLPFSLGFYLLIRFKGRSFDRKKAAIGAVVGFVLPHLLVSLRTHDPNSYYLNDPSTVSFFDYPSLYFQSFLFVAAISSAIGCALMGGICRQDDLALVGGWIDRKKPLITNPRNLAIIILIPFGILLLALINPLVAMGAIVFAFATYLRRKPASIVKHKPDPLSEAVLGDSIRKSLNDSHGVWCGQQGGEDLYISIEDRAVVVGPPGTGKTAFLVTQLLKWAESRRPFITLDIKPEIYGITRELLMQKGYEVITYNPTSQTGHRYNLLDDLDSPESIGELATNLIPSPNPADAVFHANARDFLDAIITHCRAIGQGNFPYLMEFVSQFDNYRELFNALLQSPAPDTVMLIKGLSLIAANERMLGSIFATFRSNLRFLRYPAIRASLMQSDFTLKVFTERKPVALFLQFEERHQELTSQLFSIMVNHILRYLIEHQNREPVLIQLDEIGNAPIIENLPKKLNTIRSRHMPLWLYWQGLAQMQPYGQKADEGANIILGACDFQMVFRLNDNASAEWMSKRLHLVDVVIESESISQQGVEMTHSRFKTLQQEPALFAQELQRLKKGEAVCVYQEKAWRAQATPYFAAYPPLLGVKPTPEACLAAPYPPTILETEPS